MADQTLDTKGLACPLPILKVKKVLAGMPKGATLEVFATDPGSVPDFQAFAEATGNPCSSTANRTASTALSCSIPHKCTLPLPVLAGRGSE
jgi:tRNA 2-thiouridine synthesizing protein A